MCICVICLLFSFAIVRFKYASNGAYSYFIFGRSHCYCFVVVGVVITAAGDGVGDYCKWQ